MTITDQPEDRPVEERSRTPVAGGDQGRPGPPADVVPHPARRGRPAAGARPPDGAVGLQRAVAAHERNSYTIFYRQLIWVAVGLPMAYVASRMTPRHFRMLAYLALLGSVFLLVLTYTPAR